MAASRVKKEHMLFGRVALASQVERSTEPRSDRPTASTISRNRNEDHQPANCVAPCSIQIWEGAEEITSIRLVKTMCRGYITAFAACRHINRVVEQPCSNAARLGSPHCEILVTKPETERHRQGSCVDCTARSRARNEVRGIHELNKVVRKGDVALGSPSRSVRRREMIGQAKGEQKVFLVEEAGEPRSGSEIHLSPVDEEVEDLTQPEELYLNENPEVFYRSPPRRHGKARMEETPISRSRLVVENDEECCSEDGNEDGSFRVGLPDTTRETVDFSRWLCSLSVIDASTQQP